MAYQLLNLNGARQSLDRYYQQWHQHGLYNSCTVTSRKNRLKLNFIGQ